MLVKKCTPCQGVVWFSPSKCHIFYTGFWNFSRTLLTQLKPPEVSEQAAKKVEGAALKLPPGLTCPGPCEPKFWKNDLPANLFLLNVLPQKCNKVTPAFLIKLLEFFFLFLSSNIAPWVQAEWTNMCLNLVMQKIKIMNLFCLPEYSILIGHYETTGLRSIFTLLSPMWTIHFTLVLIQFICVACLLVCKYTNQKKVDLCTNSDWSLIYSGKKYCILIGRFDATFFQSLTRLYCISALISEATILLNWLES